VHSTRRAAVALVAVLVLSCLALGPGGAVRGATLVKTQGISMEPRFSTGDLAVLLPADGYAVGDVVAYRSELLQTVVMHRIVAEDGGRFVLQGDNNDWLDPELIPPDAVLGALALRVPQGGAWMDRLTAPPVLAGTALLLLAGGTATQTRRSHRRRGTMSRHAARPTFAPPRLDALPPALHGAASVVAGAVLLSCLVGVVAWTTPTTERTTVPRATGGAVEFSYSAAVAPSPAYDGTVVTSPDPVFRRLAEVVEVRYAYAGPPATVAVVAELSTASGWRTTLPLAQRSAVPTGEQQGAVRLDLPALATRAQAAAAATGLPVERVAVRVVADIQAVGAAAFRPALPLDLTPLRLELAGDPAALRVTDPAQTAVAVEADRRLGVLGRTLPVKVLRVVSAGVLLAGLLAGALLLTVARRSAPRSEADGIHRRYASILVEVQPMPSAAGRPVVDMTAFSTLARLAERYGLLVLHWSRSGVETFVVQDDSTTFRYRSGASDLAPVSPDPVETPVVSTTVPPVRGSRL